MLGRMQRALFALVLVLGVVSCLGSASEALPLTVGVDASRTTATLGDTIIFTVTIQGESLIGVTMDFADGTGDQFGAGGAKTGKILFRKAFTQRGSFEVVATVTDAMAGQRSARVGIIVN